MSFRDGCSDAQSGIYGKGDGEANIEKRSRVQQSGIDNEGKRTVVADVGAPAAPPLSRLRAKTAGSWSPMIRAAMT
jgi:hypothetical protein